MNDYSYLYHIFSVLFLYVFLGGIIPILLGVFFAQKTKRIVSYALMALIIFLVSSTSDFIPDDKNITKLNTNALKNSKAGINNKTVTVLVKILVLPFLCEYNASSI